MSNYIKNKDQDAIAGLYVEGFNNESNPVDPQSNDTVSMSVEDIVRSNISVGLDQLNNPEYNGHALASHIQNIFDTLRDENIPHDPYEVEPLIIQYIKSS